MSGKLKRLIEKRALIVTFLENGGFIFMEHENNAPHLSSDLLRGHTETIVLAILHRGDAYGFQIYNAILEKTGERYELKETTLYSSYKRLLEEGCITSYWGDETQGARRRYYHITDKGRERYKEKIQDWEFTRDILENLMKVDG
jgi:DNA-binding PadR family transcriptional regulator